MSFRETAYKAQFQEWNWEKNLRKPITDFILRKEEQRKAQGKETTFVYRGITIPRAKVNRIGKRRLTDSLAGYDSRLKTPRGLSYRTPKLGDRIPNDLCCSKPVDYTEDFATWLGLIKDAHCTTDTNFKHTELVISLYIANFDLISTSTLNLQSNNPICDKVDATLKKFITRCRLSNDMNAALSYFSDPLLLSKRRLIGDRWIVWQDHETVARAVLFSRALCLANVQRHSESEILLDKLLTRYSGSHCETSKQDFSKTFPTIVLVSKVYLAQDKYYSLRTLVYHTLDNLKNEREMAKQRFMLHKLLCTAMMLKIRPEVVRDLDLVERLEKRVLTDLLTAAADVETFGDLHDKMFALGALELLRHRCWHFHGIKGADLPAIVEREQYLLDKTWKDASSGIDRHVTLVAAEGLIESLGALKRDREAERWESRFKQRHNWSDLEYGLSVPFIPFFKIVTRFVEQEWPFLSLTREGPSVSAVRDVSSTSSTAC